MALGEVTVKVNLEHKSLRESAELLLLSFSEWLDTEGLMAAPKRDDHRSHEDIAREFLDRNMQNGEQ